jgi:hypothetical protein
MLMRLDNAVTVYNLQRQGAGIAHLHMTRAIFSILQRLDIRLHVCHIPGVENVLTDALSRMDRTGDYELRADVYLHAIQTLQVRPTLDLFASAHNHKCPRFVSWPGPAAAGAEAQDAFTLRSWNIGLPSIIPPVQIIDRVLQRIVEERVTAVVVIPKWTGRPWWGQFRPIACTVLELGSSKEVLIPGPAMRSSLTEKKLPPGTFLMAILSPPGSKSMGNA